MIRICYYSDASCADAYHTGAMGDLLRNQTNALDHVQNLEIHAVCNHLTIITITIIAIIAARCSYHLHRY